MEHREFTTDTVRELSQEWNQLRLEMMNRKKIEYDVFKRIFSNTYKAMEEVVAEDQIDREYLGLILSAHNFASLQVETTSDMSYAALVLTERMLQYCALDNNKTEVPRTGISNLYILEERKEIKIDFNDVDQSISTLTEILKRCWKRM